MYDLGQQFRPNYERALTNPGSIIQGAKYRISILTDNVFRFEYSETGSFNDKPTELIWNRNFKKPDFTIKDDGKYLQIDTKYAIILYQKNKEYPGNLLNPSANLSVKLKNSEKFWYYNHPEARNVGTSLYEIPQNKLEKVNKLSDLILEKGLFSYDGFVSIDNSKDKIINEDGTLSENESKNIDTYLIIYGTNYHICLSNYYELTGRPALIPRYALGNWWNKNDHYNENTLKEFVDKLKEEEIPISVLTLEKDWHKLPSDKKGEINSGFTFDKDKFPNPLEISKYLYMNNIILGLSVNPFNGFYNIDENYEKVTQYLTPDENGVIPFNVLDPKTLDVYLKLYLHPLEALGVAFFWIDTDKKDESVDILKNYQFYDLLKNYQKRPMVLCNKASLAPHRYPVINLPHVETNWNSLKLLSLYNVTLPNIGASWWSFDIGGYKNGIEEEELYTRFIQLGTFSPILRLNSDTGKYYKREPWLWNIKTYTIAKNFLTLRHKLIPYIYSEAYKYSTTGNLFIEPLYYYEPSVLDDELYYNEYFFGTQLLVSPIIKQKDQVMNRTIHRLHIPDGIWYDFFSGKKFPGPNNYVSFYKDEDYPIFAKAGSIIPLAVNNQNNFKALSDMEIQIFPGKSNTFDLYEDDGMSNLYRKDFYIKTEIDYNYMPNNYTVIIRALEGKSGIIPPTRNYKFIFRNTKKADDVIVYENDKKLSAEFYVDGSNFIVEIKDVSTIGQITINCKGKDIEIDAVRIINKDIEQILSDLQIETQIKEKIDSILFSEQLTNSKKRIEIRKLSRYGLESKFIKLFLKLLEYIKKV